VKQVFRAFCNAVNGLRHIAKGWFFKAGLAFGIVAVAVSWFFGFTVFDRLVVLTFTFLVLCFEGFNSTLERLLDLIFPKYDERVKIVKDMQAGTVLIGVVGAVLVGIFILVRALQIMAVK
jgi:diacylglycerol kinase